MLSTFAHTRSLLSVDLLITFEGRSENSDDVPKEKPLTALASVTVVDLDGKPEGLALTAQGRAIVGPDTRKPRRYLVLLKPAIAHLRGCGQSLS